MPKSKLLIVIVAALTLPSCAVYMHDDRPYRPAAERPPCDHEHARGPHDGRVGVIGLAIGRGAGSGRGPIVVENVIPGSPAGDADIRAGDRIRAIDGESTRGMKVSEAARLIRGRADTAVELRVDSPRGSRLITLVRVPPRAFAGRHDRPCDGRRCEDHHCRHRHEMEAPPPEPPPAVDESLAPEVWPPTKPGNSATY